MIGNAFINIVGAYSRKYFSKEEALKDWNQNVDFMIQNSSTHIRKRDHERYAPHKRVCIYIEFGRYETLVETTSTS